MLVEIDCNDQIEHLRTVFRMFDGILIESSIFQMKFYKESIFFKYHSIKEIFISGRLFMGIILIN